MMKKIEAKRKAQEVYRQWRQDIPDPPSGWPDKNAMPFYGFLCDEYPHLLDFKSGQSDPYQEIKSWVLDWDQSIGDYLQ